MSPNGNALRLTVALLAIAPEVAFAQEAGTAQEPAAEPAPGEKAKFGEEVVVTGSRIRRKEVTSAAPVAVITSEQIQASGKLTIGDFLQTLPSQGNALNTLVNNGGDGSTQISLRSLGPQRTLVLVNGKRFITGVPGGGNLGDPGADLNSIPTAAVERIEVLKDGASAVYGSDAIGGVVNIITRRRINTVGANASYQISEHGDTQIYDVNVLGGASGEKGGFQLGLGYYNQGSLYARSRDWASFAKSYDYASGTETNGGSSRIPQGRAQIDPALCPTLLCQQLNADFPGVGRTQFMPDPAAPHGWRPYTGADAYNFQAVNFLVTPSERISLYASGDYDIGSNARAYFHSTFVNRNSSTMLAPVPLDTGSFGLVYSAASQYNPFGVDILDARRRFVEGGGRAQAYDIDTLQLITGVDGTLPSILGPLAGWFYDMSFNYARNNSTVTTNGSINTQLTGQAIGPSQNGVCYTDATYTTPIPGCTPANWFGIPFGQPMTPAMVTSLGGFTGVNHGFNQMVMVEANLLGELFKIMAERPTSLALGYAFRRETGFYTYNPIAVAGFDSDYNGQNTKGDFYVNEGYAELLVPLVSGMAGVEELELAAALRYSNYNTFGDTTTYKVGGRYSPIVDATLRGTYSTGFRAPGITSLYGGTGPNAESASDPCGNPALIPALANTADPLHTLAVQCTATLSRGGGGTIAAGNGDDNVQILSTSGGNARLQPEKADIWTVGLVIQPTFMRNLTITADYFNVKIRQNINFITTPIILAGCYPGAGGTPSQAYCDLILRGPNGQIRDVTDLLQNVGKTSTDGLDVAIRYALPSPAGRFSFAGEATFLFKYDQTLAGGTVVKGVGTYDLAAYNGGVLPRVKFNLGFGYDLSGFSALLNGRFIGSFHECANADGASDGSGLCYKDYKQPDGTPYPVHQVPLWSVWDLHLGYTLPWSGGTTNLGAGVKNLFNTDPPRVYNTAASTNSDPYTYDYIGRAYYFQLAHRF